MSFIHFLLLASGLFQSTTAAPALAVRSISCPASNNTIYTAGSSNFIIECGIDRNGGDMSSPNGQQATTLDACISQCQARSGCVLVDYISSAKACYLKSTVGYIKANSAVIGARSVASSPSATSAVTTSTPTTSVSATTLASSVTSTVAPTPSSVTSGARKRGLCFNNNTMAQFFGGTGSKVSWSYNWGQTVASTGTTSINSAFKYIPMLWSNSTANTQNWNSNALAAISAGADTLLGFNEPDHPNQANMPVSTAVSTWKQYMEPFAGKVRLAAPAVTNGGSPMGLSYLTSFISSCTGCTIDVCPIHWYDSATNIGYFKSYMAQAYTACGNKPIWITEFGASGTEADITTFLKTVLPWLDSLDYVERYAYFYDGASTDGVYLVNSAGTGLSAIGQIFNTY